MILLLLSVTTLSASEVACSLLSNLGPSLQSVRDGRSYRPITTCRRNGCRCCRSLITIQKPGHSSRRNIEDEESRAVDKDRFEVCLLLAKLPFHERLPERAMEPKSAIKELSSTCS